ncbi:MAG TPA: nucleoside-diphosphate sugar epimerase/dehydratase [Solirubrobacteraceae bacterium]|jgi:FlaA1/EpsC-like NDP-sugar epimerase|nr:nucleoside-diphosphate sugar epimerase/dehydratase [Solirubrobacteraceae bacterium]
MRRRIRSAAFPLHRHSLLQIVVDGILVALAYWLSYRLRFDGPSDVPPRYRELFEATLAVVVATSLLTFAAFGMYGKWWRYVTQRDFTAIVQAVVVASLLVPGYVALAKPVTQPSPVGETPVTAPTGVLALHFLLVLTLVGGARFAARTIHERPLRGFRAGKDARGLLIVGAGDGGRLVLREILRNPELGLKPVGFVDDDPTKRRLRIDGVRVLGATSELGRILDEAEPDEVTIAIPSAPGTLRAAVVRACRERGIPVRTLPTVFELLQTGGTFVGQARDVQVEDILGREPVRMELDRVGAYLNGEVVLVTGAGGSIGKELSRQIARVAPRRLVLLDHAEDNLFQIQRELEHDRHVHPSTLEAVLADCKEEERMREVFGALRPTVVFHAAAYKHVGLMEQNPVEAVRNNAIATRIMARIAGQAGAKAFVLVSTDKAVAPATVMGASKALAEFALEAEQARFPRTRYCAVRFGNVLGSSGSVVPIFRRQIALGGPITVTDERMTRYFMTIPEAVQLIIRAGGLTNGAAGGRRKDDPGAQVYVLEMGEPVRILDLARTMIELSGLDAERDIAIEIIGRRPGEKLHEELFNPYERPQPTPAEKILRAEREPRPAQAVDDMFDQIGLLVLEGDAAGLAAKVSELSAVPDGWASRIVPS